MSQVKHFELPDGTIVDVPSGGEGTSVEPNPELSGDEEALNSIKIADTKYKIEGGGGAQVQSDWTEEDDTAPAFIQNKPLDLVHISKDSSEIIVKDSQMINSPFPLAINEETGEYGYIKKVEGADTFCPFSASFYDNMFEYIFINDNINSKYEDYQMFNKNSIQEFNENGWEIWKNNSGISTPYVLFKVDLTNVNTILAKFVNILNPNVLDIYTTIFIGSTNTITPFSNYEQREHKQLSANKIELNSLLDVRKYSGEYYVGISINTDNSSWSSNRNGYCKYLMLIKQ